MTCIVGIVHPVGVTMGADSRYVEGYVSANLSARYPKIYRKGPMLMGTTGSSRMAHILHYALAIPEHPADMDVQTYLDTKFADALRECLKNAGHYRKDNENESSFGNVLFAYRGHLYHVDTQYAVSEADIPYYAVGSGQEVALGALHVALELKADPQQSARMAIEAATKFCYGVGGNIVVKTLEHDND